MCSVTALPANCSFQGVSVAVGKLLTAAATIELDDCTVEGLPGGTVLPEIHAANSKLPGGSCQITADCGSTDLICDTSSSTPFCTCQGGVDRCKPISICKPTPCSLCDSCIQSLVTKFLPANLYEGREAVAANFNAVCPTLLGASTEQCSVVSNKILYNLPRGNIGRRAGLLCAKLGVCTSSMMTACKLVVNKPSTGTNLTGYLDLCTVEGVSGGSRLDGISISPGKQNHCHTTRIPYVP